MMGGKVGPLSCEISIREIEFQQMMDLPLNNATTTPTALYISQEVSGHIAHLPPPILCILYRIS